MACVGAGDVDPWSVSDPWQQRSDLKHERKSFGSNRNGGYNRQQWGNHKSFAKCDLLGAQGTRVNPPSVPVPSASFAPDGLPVAKELLGCAIMAGASRQVVAAASCALFRLLRTDVASHAAGPPLAPPRPDDQQAFLAPFAFEVKERISTALDHHAELHTLLALAKKSGRISAPTANVIQRLDNAYKESRHIDSVKLNGILKQVSDELAQPKPSEGKASIVLEDAPVSVSEARHCVQEMDSSERGQCEVATKVDVDSCLSRLSKVYCADDSEQRWATSADLSERIAQVNRNVLSQFKAVEIMMENMMENLMASTTKQAVQGACAVVTDVQSKLIQYVDRVQAQAEQLFAANTSTLDTVEKRVDSISNEIKVLRWDLDSAVDRSGVGAPREMPAVPCKFYPLGLCTKGTLCRFAHEQDSARESSSSIPVPDSLAEDPDFFLQGVVAYARLHGLSQASLNGAVGRVLGFESSKGRWKIQIHGSQEVKLIKRANLVQYVPLPSDTCQQCNDPVNLCARPACGCPDS